MCQFNIAIPRFEKFHCYTGSFEKFDGQEVVKWLNGSDIAFVSAKSNNGIVVGLEQVLLFVITL